MMATIFYDVCAESAGKGARFGLNLGWAGLGVRVLMSIELIHKSDAKRLTKCIACRRYTDSRKGIIWVMGNMITRFRDIWRRHLMEFVVEYASYP